MQKGLIEIAVGPMFSGKTSWLINKMKELKKNNISHLTVRFGDDNRYSKDAISSHDKIHFAAYSAKSAQDIRILLKKFPDIVAFGIDELQFFEKEVAGVLRELKKKNINVYAAGLDTDFLGKEWDVVTEALEDADIVNKFKAICSVCKEKIATRTQRLIDGLPASKNSPRLLIGGSESYTARCDLHHQIGA